MAAIANTAIAGEGQRPIDRRVEASPYRRLAGGLAWTAASTWSAQLLSWASTLIIARLLSPEDFGLVGMATVFLGLVTVLSEFGLGSTVVYRRAVGNDQLDQLNTLAVAFGAAAFLVSWLLAAPLGRFFKAPQLGPVVIGLGFGFVLSAFQVIPYGLLQRDQAFRRLAGADAARTVTQAATTVVLALLGFRYWSLVLGGIAGTIVSAAILRRARPCGFAWPRLAAIHSDVAFSRDVLVSRVSWYAYSNADFAVAGRVLGAADLGAYTLAWNLASASINKLTDLVSRVGPAFVSEAQHDAAALRRYLRGITAGISLVTFPATIGLALIAPEAVAGLLGQRWQAAIVPLQFLALYAAIRSLTALLSPVMSAIDLRWAARYSLAFPAVFPAAFYAASRSGIAGIAGAWVLLYPVMYVPIYRRLFSKIGMPVREYVNAIRPAVDGTAVMAAAIVVVKACWPVHWRPLPFVAAEMAIGGTVYLTVLVAAHRDRVHAIWRVCAPVRSAPVQAGQR